MYLNSALLNVLNFHTVLAPVTCHSRNHKGVRHNINDVPVSHASETAGPLTPTCKLNAAIANIISYTCAFPAMSQNVYCEKGLMVSTAMALGTQCELRSCRLRDRL